MPRSQFNRSMVATLLGLLIAVPAAVLTMATPAAADAPCCQVALNGVPGQFQAGGAAKPFSLRVVNRTGDPMRYLTATFVLHANGLNGNQVHLERQRLLGGPRGVGARSRGGQVVATDQIDFGIAQVPPGGGVTIQYRLSFGQKAPAGGLSIAVRVQPRKGNGAAADAGPYQSSILAFAAQPTKPTAAPTTAQPTTAAPTDTAVETPSDTATDAFATQTDPGALLGGKSSGDSGGSMWLVYTIGALLLLGGIGVIGWMLYRRGREDEPEYDDGYAAAGYADPAPDGYAASGHQPGFHTPTQAMPRPDAQPRHGAMTRIMPPTTQYPDPQYADPQHQETQYADPQYPAPQDPYAQPDQTWVDPNRR